MTRSEIVAALRWPDRAVHDDEPDSLLSRIERLVAKAVAEERAKHGRTPDQAAEELERLRGIARASGRLR